MHVRCSQVRYHSIHVPNTCGDSIFIDKFMATHCDWIVIDRRQVSIKSETNQHFGQNLARETMNNSTLVLVLAGAICWVSLVSAQVKPQEKAIAMVRKLANEFGPNPAMTSSGMTYDDYVAGVSDLLTNFPKEYIEERRRISPHFRLIEDFIVKPMLRWRLSDNEPDVIKAAYVKRMEDTYKRFWPAYIEGNFIDERTLYNARVLVNFAKATLVYDEDKPTLQDWRNAYAQYQAMDRWMQELVNDHDIYEHLDDYGLAMNLKNDDKIYKVMCFADEFNACKNEQEFRQVLSAFRLKYEVKKPGISLFTRFNLPDITRPRTPGMIVDVN